MSRVLRTIVFSRLLILTWLVAWVTTAPLFHVHLPDTTGYDPTSVQGGVVHTVFTPDLPGEFFCPHDTIAYVSNRVLNGPELGIALLNNDPEDQLVEKSTVMVSPSVPPNWHLPPNSGIEVRAVHRNLLLACGGPPTSRAPPSIVAL